MKREQQADEAASPDGEDTIYMSTREYREAEVVNS
jgi:hypothetical protein